jgi:hypothetical protein
MYGSQTPGAGAAPAPPATFMVTKRSTGLTVLVVAAAAVAAVVVLGIVTAVAIPVLLAQSMRAEWKATTFVVPETFEGTPRAEVPAALLRAEVADDVTGPVQAGRYRIGAVDYTVLAAKGKKPLTEDQQAAIRRGYASGLASNGLGLQLTAEEPGELGGYFGCGFLTSRTAQVTTCISTDHAGVVVIVATGSADSSAIAEAGKLRRAVVKR